MSKAKTPRKKNKPKTPRGGGKGGKSKGNANFASVKQLMAFYLQHDLIFYAQCLLFLITHQTSHKFCTFNAKNLKIPK